MRIDSASLSIINGARDFDHMACQPTLVDLTNGESTRPSGPCGRGFSSPFPNPEDLSLPSGGRALGGIGNYQYQRGDLADVARPYIGLPTWESANYKSRILTRNQNHRRDSTRDPLLNERVNVGTGNSVQTSAFIGQSRIAWKEASNGFGNGYSKTSHAGACRLDLFRGRCDRTNGGECVERAFAGPAIRPDRRGSKKATGLDALVAAACRSVYFRQGCVKKVSYLFLGGIAQDSAY
jgi:hypothetical protein